jgi:hypothetical protein
MLRIYASWTIVWPHMHTAHRRTALQREGASADRVDQGPSKLPPAWDSSAPATAKPWELSNRHPAKLENRQGYRSRRRLLVRYWELLGCDETHRHRYERFATVGCEPMRMGRSGRASEHLEHDSVRRRCPTPLPKTSVMGMRGIFGRPIGRFWELLALTTTSKRLNGPLVITTDG